MCASVIPLRKYCVKSGHSHQSTTGLRHTPGEGVLATRILLYLPRYKKECFEQSKSKQSKAGDYNIKLKPFKL